MDIVSNIYSFLLKLSKDNDQIYFKSFAYMDDLVDYCCFIHKNNYNDIGHAYVYINLYDYIRAYPENNPLSKVLFLRIDFTFWGTADKNKFKHNFRYDLYWYNQENSFFNIHVNKILMDEINNLDIIERIFDDYDFDQLITSGISYNLRTGETYVISKT
jgi:hypothetical protein